MSRRKRDNIRREKLISETTIENENAAKTILSESGMRMKRIHIGLIIAAAATVFSIIGWTHFGTNVAGVCNTIGLIGAIASYVLSGGILIALRLAWKIGVIGWIATPFPIDLVAGLFTLIFAFTVFLFFPILFVFISFMQNRFDCKHAEEYLSSAMYQR